MRAFLMLFMVPLGAKAQVRTGGPYAARIEASTSGGGAVSSASYRSQASVVPMGAVSGSSITPYVNRAGFAGQIANPVSLTLAASPATVEEGGTRGLTASAVMDDATTLALSTTDPAWSVASGPLVSVSPSGAVLAAGVYEDSSAMVSASWQGMSGSLELTVLNVLTDNFGLYAGDSLPDDWQVLHFGVGNPSALAGEDPDGDGQDNRFEYLAGIHPNNPLSRFLLEIHPVPAEPSHKELRFEPVWPDRTYVVEQSPTLGGGGPWTPVTGTTHTMSGVRTVTDTDAVAPERFYRVRIRKP